MQTAYLTRSWAVVFFDFGPTLDTQDSSGLPAVLLVRRAPDYRTPEPAWLVTPEVLAHLCWRMDSANAEAAPGDPEAIKRVNRWLAVLDALAGLWERLRGEVETELEKIKKIGLSPLPVVQIPLVVRKIAGVEIMTPWDTKEAEAFYELDGEFNDSIKTNQASQTNTKHRVHPR